MRSRRIYLFGGFTLDAEARTLRSGDTAVPLSPKAFDILLLLVESSPDYVSKQELLDRVWTLTHVSDATLSQHIFLLRKAVNQDGQASIIETVPKSGYRLNCPVTLEDAAVHPGEKASTVVAMRTGGGEELDGSAVRVVQFTPRLAVPQPAPKRIPSVWLGGALCLAAAAGLGLWLQPGRPPAPTEAVAVTPDGRFALEPGFSPTGESIVYIDQMAEAGFDLFRKDLNSGLVVRLTNSPADDHGPVWSPDGHFIAFLRVGLGENALFLMPSEGGEPRRLTSVAMPSDGGRIAWLPDSETLVYFDAIEGQAGASLQTLNTRTGERRVLTRPPSGARDQGPAMSPDGKWLAFVRVLSDAAADLYVMPVGGGEPRRLTNENFPMGMISWAPEGGSILFAGRYRGKGGLWRVSLEGGDATRVIHRFVGPFATTAAGGGRLVFTVGYADENIWRLDLPEPEQGPVAKAALWIGSDEIDGAAAVSPDGSRIAFVSTRTGQTELWTTETQPLHAKQITQFQGPEVFSPSWSPDGRWILFESRAKGRTNIYRIGSDGGSPTALTEEEYAGNPLQSHDGKWITYTSTRSGRRELWRMRAEGGPGEQITRGGGSAHQHSPDGRWIYFSVPNRPGLWKIPWAGGPETLASDRVPSHMQRYWTVGTKGLYFIEPSPAENRYKFLRVDLNSGKEFLLFTSTRAQPEGLGTLALAPNERWLLFTQTDRSGRQLMLVGNFR